MGYRIGIDAGSKTVKVVILNDDNSIHQYIYRKHKSDIRTTLIEVIHEIAWRCGNLQGPVCVTGSAGIGVAEMLGLPFVQEVVATTRAVKALDPDADAVVELGGEDAKVVYLTGGLEQRMNATCAGGTGGFIDTIAFMLGIDSKELGRLAQGSSTTYPIASRCAVFAQTDVRPLLNAGVRKSDIAASVLDAVVRQTLGGLACGRPITGNVVFLGGPFEYLPDLVRRFRIALGMNGRKPQNAHLYIATGAAISAGEDQAPMVTLNALEECLINGREPEDDLEHLAPLFNTDSELREFRQRHAQHVMAKSSFAKYEGDAYLGIDAGSTTVKLVLIGDSGEMIYNDYQPTEGDALATASWMIEEMYKYIPKIPSAPEPLITIKHATVTGYGEDLMISALGVDSGVVETTAHLKGALAFDPEATFVLDIGGQDMKALWVKDGMVTDAVLNEACSSGCGSFIEGTAYSLRSTPYRFAEAALSAKAPIELGTKCTVFMTSRVRHAQKIGASHADIAAGLAYSVVQNALYRIIGRDKVKSMGDHIVVQGGAFKSDAVLAAFEKVSGLEVIRPDTAHLMGAIGAALMAKERAEVLYAKHGRENVHSTFVSRQALAALNPKREALVCPGCQNACTLTKLTFGDKRVFISGNRCDRAYDALDLGAASAPKEHAPNVMKVQQGLLGQCKGNDNEQGKRSGSVIGVMNTLFSYDQMPFWQELFVNLGFRVVMPTEQRTREAASLSAESIPSESVCFPAKLSHSRLYDMVGAGAKAVFMPTYHRGSQCSVSCEYACALSDSAPIVHDGSCTICKPQLASSSLEDMLASVDDRRALMDAVAALSLEMGEDPIDQEEFESAIEAALAAQSIYEERLRKATARALEWVHETPEHHGIILAGRPYHVDPMLLHGIDGVLENLGFAVLTEAGIRLALGAPKDADQLSSRVNWPDALRHADVVDWDIADDSLDAVLLQSFGCGFDSICLESVRDQLAWHGLPCAILKIDDMIDTAHVRIRLRTLAESIEGRKANGILSMAGRGGDVVGNGNPLGLGAGATKNLSDWGLDYGAANTADAKPQARPEVPVEKAPATFLVAGVPVAIPEGHYQVEGRKGSWNGSFNQESAESLGDLTEVTRGGEKTLDDYTARIHWTGGGQLSREKVVEGPADFEQVADEDDYVARLHFRGGGTVDTISLEGHEANAHDVEKRAAGGGRSQIVTRPKVVTAAGTLGVKPLAPMENFMEPKRESAPVGRTVAGLQNALSHVDLEYARGYVPSDMCFTAASLAARAISMTLGNPEVSTVRLPKVCVGCMVDAIPGVVSRACNRPILIEWTQAWPEKTPQQPDDLTAQPAADAQLRIGIVGNPLLCFEPYLNDDLPGMIEAFGCQCVMPDPAKLYTDDVRYIDQLEEFQAKHVDHVIYLQSFGCLKGHVHARGSLHGIGEMFPDMPVTVIDYDPEASALNRENRVRLAIEAAHAARPEAVMRMRTRSKATSWLTWAQDSTDTGRRELLMDSESHQQTGTAALAYSVEVYDGREKCAGPEELQELLAKHQAEVNAQIAELQRQANTLGLALGELEGLQN